jgi:hypothetical protein
MSSLRHQDRIWVLGPVNTAQHLALIGLIMFALFWVYLLFMAITSEHGEGHKMDGRTGRRLTDYILG